MSRFAVRYRTPSVTSDPLVACIAAHTASRALGRRPIRTAVLIAIPRMLC
jgi:hypothetical protein